MCSCIDVFFPLTSVWNKNKDYCSCILLFPLLKIFKDFFGGVVFSPPGGFYRAEAWTRPRAAGLCHCTAGTPGGTWPAATSCWT